MTSGKGRWTLLDPVGPCWTLLDPVLDPFGWVILGWRYRSARGSMSLFESLISLTSTSTSVFVSNVWLGPLLRWPLTVLTRDTLIFYCAVHWRVSHQPRTINLVPRYLLV